MLIRTKASLFTHALIPNATITIKHRSYSKKLFRNLKKIYYFVELVETNLSI